MKRDDCLPCLAVALVLVVVFLSLPAFACGDGSCDPKPDPKPTPVVVQEDKDSDPLPKTINEIEAAAPDALRTIIALHEAAEARADAAYALGVQAAALMARSLRDMKSISEIDQIANTAFEDAAAAISTLATQSPKAAALAVPEVQALKDAATLARNRMQRLAVEMPFGSAIRFEANEWSQELTDALAALIST